MASPVVINSSSPTSLRLLSVTPPSLQRGAHSSSSPELPSPALLVGPKRSALKSGSRAQAAPLNAGFGFSTAGSLWRESQLKPDDGQDRVADEKRSDRVVGATAKKSLTIDRDAQKPDQNAGKLKKPKKSARKQVETESVPDAANRLDLHLEDSICASDVKAMREDASTKRNAKASNPPEQSAIPRKPSADLSESAFGVYELGMQTQAPAAVAAAKKPRKKKAAAPIDPKGKNNSADKPRKRKPKSEAMTLNSDDPNLSHAERQALKHSKTSGSKGKRRSKAKSKDTAADDPDPLNHVAEASRSHSRDHAVETSAYFRGAPTSDSVNGLIGQTAGSKSGEKACGAEQETVEPTSPTVAVPRRSQWTPVKDTVSALPNAADDADTTSISSKMQLADLIGDFGYTLDDARETSVARTNTGEAVTKRRRIELADPASAGPVARSAQSMPKEPKKPTGRKKLQTITGLATAAYKVEQEHANDQSTVSEFFAARKGKERPAKEPEQPCIEKPKQPRKPRKKKETAARADVEKGTRKSGKGKKAKIKFNEADYLPQLYSPARAAEQMRQQEFLFGTSSQLVIDEPAEFIRDMQTALRASELDEKREPDGFGSQLRSSEMLPSQYSRLTPREGKSCSKMPTAPHVTCLSLRQAHRELWCVSSRDHDGGLLREERGGSRGVEPLLPNAQDRSCEPATNLTTAQRQAEEDRTDILTNDEDAVDATPTKDADPVIDLSNTSPVASDHGAEESVVAFKNTADLPLARSAQGKARQRPDAEPQANGDWMLISSDGPGVEIGPDRVPAARRASFSPDKVRTALRPLDVNSAIPPLFYSKAKADPQAHTTSTRRPAADDKPAFTKKGRPRKHINMDTVPDASPKRREKGPMRLAIASDPSSELARFKKPRAAMSASQPLHSPSGWLDIDEISDTEPAVTPSPSRKKHPASPSMPALDVTVNGSPVSKIRSKTPVAGPAHSTLKPGEPQWNSIRDAIFPKITSTIRDASRGTDPSRPSWYQKILMYDPITLEELTTWLNEQGLQIEMQKLKTKVKKRGRKKRDADGKVIEADHVDEWETHQEPLQAWMVQKWCEERSICCVFSGGGWGGRSRH